MFAEEGETDDPAATVEVVQNLIEHHNAVFTDANVTSWRWTKSNGQAFV